MDIIDFGAALRRTPQAAVLALVIGLLANARWATSLITAS